MKHAETVTFGGSGLDRASELRTDPDALGFARGLPDAVSILLWRGKPLVSGKGRDTLVRLPMAHPLIANGPLGNTAEPILLGREDATPVFAADISSWAPAGPDQTTPGQFQDPGEQHCPGLPQDHVFAELRHLMTRLSPRDAELAASARVVLGWHRTHSFCAACGHPSDMARGGWQRTCPACGAHHFPRTDPVVIMLVTHGSRVLVGRSPGWPPGMFSLLAGFIEPGETLEAAVRREVFEESGIRVGHVRYLACQPWPFPASLMFGCHGDALGTDITINADEIEAAMWLSKAEMMQVFAGEHPALKPARKGAIAHFLLQNWLADTLD